MSQRPGPLALRASFTATSRVTPRRAARRPADLWFTVPARPIPPSPADPPGGHSRILTGENGPLTTWFWGTGPVICFVHGWAGRGHQVNALVEPLLDRGFQVVTFDAPGHGASAIGGREHSNAVQTARALVAVTAEYGPFHAVVAHSLGAVATMIATRRNWIDARQFALIAPVTEVRSQLDSFTKALGLGSRARCHLDDRVGRHTGLGIDDFSYSGQDASLQGTPLLAVHDLQDRFVHHHRTAGLVATWPEARLISTEGLGHVRILNDPRVAGELAEWISSGLPVSGAVRPGHGPGQPRHRDPTRR
ncbi:alpha/beta hydrolase [Nakamurella sp. GG22]